MVFVGVGQHDPLELVGVGGDPAEVGDDDLDAGQVAAGKHQAAVDEHPFAGVLEGHAVEAYFSKASQRNDSKHVKRSVCLSARTSRANLRPVRRLRRRP